MTRTLVLAHVAAVVCALGMVGFGGAVHAQVTIPQEYGKTIKSAEVVGALGNDLFGEQVNLYTGSTSFAVTDVSIPGNDSLPMRIGRRYVVEDRDDDKRPGLFADWELDIPWLSGVFAKNAGWQTYDPQRREARCSIGAAGEMMSTPPDAFGNQGGIFAPEEFWAGHTLHVPGQGDMEMLVPTPANPQRPTDGAQYVWTTSERWYFSCLPTINNGAGEGFLALAPDGTRYWFDWMVKRPVKTLTKTGAGPVGFAASGSYLLSRDEVRILPTKVQDRFGNTITYTYNATNPWRLESISSPDGRSITLTYNTAGRIATVSDGARTWTYTYGTSGDLSEVRLPDTSKWTYNLTALGAAMVQQTDNVWCETRSSATTQTSYTGTITHPSGAIGTFVFRPTLHGRSYVQKNCVGGTGLGSYARHAWLFDTIALQTKTISGVGIATPAQWTYTYGATNNSWLENCPNDSCIGSKTVEVNGQGEWARHTFSNRWRHSEGKLLKVEQGTGPASILKTETTDYVLVGVGQNYPAEWGRNPFQRGDNATQQVMPVWRRVTTQQGATFTWQVDVTTGSTYDFDGHARPNSVTRSGTAGATRTDKLAYADNLSLWVLGLPASSKTGNAVEYEHSYDARALPIQTKAFGKVKYNATYNADGTLATVSDGRDSPTFDTTVTYGTWKRGIPTLITYPDLTTKAAEVNNLGQITSVTDENSHRTCYAYDPMGRLSGITYPSETEADTCNVDDWNALGRTFAMVAAPEYGLAANHWRETVTTGNSRKEVFYDALWRPVLTQTYDTANVAGTISQTVARYDANGRVIFQSYPGTGITDFQQASLTGTRTTYDALGRQTEVAQDSELGFPLKTTTRYLPGLETEVTNPRLQVTTTTYAAYDQPESAWPYLIEHPEGAITHIARDIFGKPIWMARRNGPNTQNVVRSYAYNEAQELCRVIEPETGATYSGYDGAGNIAWTASGLTGAALPCAAAETDANVIARKSVRTYDNRNRIVDLSFADDKGEQTWTYTPDGLPETITAYNGVNRNVPVINAYHYNARRMLDGMGESVQQPAWYTWSLGYGYDRNGALANHVYPGGVIVDYAPNALGQPTKAGTYATGVTYFPNGAIKQFTYGNGIVHTMTQNDRQLPDRSKDVFGSATPVLDDSYTYDANGNVAAISDGLPGAPGNRTMTYDGLDRMVSANSPMWSGRIDYTYDIFDNIQTIVGPGTNLRYCYNATQQLEFIRTGSTTCSDGAATTTLDFDVQGNVWHKNGQEHIFTQDNRLRDVVGKEGYRYDGHGRRVLSNSALGNVLSMYSQDGKIRVISDARRGKLQYYVYLGGSLVAVRESGLGGQTPVAKYLHTDALGSPVAMTDATRAVVETSKYGPYGKLLNRVARDAPGYTGHVEDAATGLTYMQQRYYDPVIGRFLSVDPVTAYSNPVGAFNRYWYANNNPYRFSDPDGRNPLAIGVLGANSSELLEGIRSVGPSSASVAAPAAQPSSFTKGDAQVVGTILGGTATAYEGAAMGLNGAGNSLAQYGSIATDAAQTWKSAGQVVGGIGALAGLGAAAVEFKYAETPADYGHSAFGGALSGAGLAGVLNPVIALSVGVIDFGVQQVDYTSKSGVSTSGWSAVHSASADGIDAAAERHNGSSACIRSACL